MKFWYFFCLLFSFYSLNLLILDRYLISYIIVEEDNKLYDNKINFLLCTSFNQIKLNDELFLFANRNPKLSKVSIYDFLNYSISSIEFKLNYKSPFDIENSFIFRDFVCFDVKKDDLNFNEFISKFSYNYNIKLYAYSDYHKPYYYEAIYHEKSKIKSILLKIFKQKVYYEKHLSRPKCLEPKEQYSLSRFKCLNTCFETHNVDFNIRHCKDNKKYDLNKISKQFNYTETNLDHNQTIWSKNLLIGLKNKELFDKCVNLCKPVYDCFYEVYNVVKERSDYYLNVSSKNNIEKVTTFLNTYLSYYSVTDFWYQFIGFATLLTGTCLVNTTLLIINKLIKKFRFQNNLYFRLFYNKFQKILILLSILFVIYQSIQIISDYSYKSKYPNRTLTFNFDNEQFKVVVCIPLEIILFDDKTIKENRNQEILNNFTIVELKEKTNINHTILFNTSYVAFILDPIISKVSKRTIFKYDEFDNQTVLTRCYKISFIINLKNYESIIPSRYLYIQFNKKINLFRRVYVIEKNQKFSTGLNDIKGEYHIGKVIAKYLQSSKKTNCMNYKNYENFECGSRNVCLDRCLSKKYLDRHKNVSIYSVIDDDIINLSLNRYFVNKKDSKIEKECKSLFQNEDCFYTNFFEEWKPNYLYNDEYILINLNYEKLMITELDQSLVKVIFDIINLEIIFFSTNALGILSFIILLIKKKFKIIKIPKLIKITICLIGFLIHNFFIFKNIANEELINTGFFKIRDELNLPIPIICFKLPDNKFLIDKNHKLTFDYYDKNYYHKYYQNIFKELWYFNRTHINHFKNINSTFSNSDIEINYFYYFKSICFEIDLKLSFNTTDFYLLETRNLVGISFNETFISKEENHYPHFIFRKRGSKDFSENFIFLAINRTNEIMFEQIELIQEDNFELLKNPLSLFSEKSNLNNVTKYLNEQVNEFKNSFNMSTLYIFLEDKDPNLIIDNDLFNQYFSQIQNISDYNQFISFNLKQKLYNIFNQQTKNDNKSAFLFSISLSTRSSYITNQDNNAKLLLNLLNTLSLWLDICILDLYVYLIKIRFIFLKLNQLLLNFKFYLNSNL